MGEKGEMAAALEGIGAIAGPELVGAPDDDDDGDREGSGRGGGGSGMQFGATPTMDADEDEEKEEAEEETEDDKDGDDDDEDRSAAMGVERTEIGAQGHREKEARGLDGAMEGREEAAKENADEAVDALGSMPQEVELEATRSTMGEVGLLLVVLFGGR
jgi:hypothetical protein